MPAAFQVDPDAVCDACGATGAYRFETETLCTDCYAHRGSCCSAEFSGRVSELATEPSRSSDTEGTETIPA